MRALHSEDESAHQGRLARVGAAGRPCSEGLGDELTQQVARM